MQGERMEGEIHRSSIGRRLEDVMTDIVLDVVATCAMHHLTECQEICRVIITPREHTLICSV
jgi:hypothetical protein